MKVRSRDGKPVTVHIPADTLASLEKIAPGRDMSVEALFKLYIGQSMRQDLAKLSADRVLEKTSAIVKEIRVEIVS